MSKPHKPLKTTDDWIEEYERNELARKQAEEQYHQIHLTYAREMLQEIMKKRLENWKKKYTREDLRMHIDTSNIPADVAYEVRNHWHLVTTENEALKCFYEVAPPSGDKTEWSVKYEKHPYGRTTLIVNIVHKGCTKSQ